MERGWDAGLLEEIHYQKHALSVHSHTPLAVCSPCLVIVVVVEDVTSQIMFLLCPPTMHSIMCAHTHKHTLHSAISL